MIIANDVLVLFFEVSWGDRVYKCNHQYPLDMIINNEVYLDRNMQHSLTF